MKPLNLKCIIFCLIIPFNIVWSQAWNNKILSTYPADNAIRMGENDSLVLVFQDPVTSLKGNLVLYNEESTTIETIPLSSAKVTGLSTSKITVKHDSLFRHDNSYYVQIDTGAFGAGFPGIKGNLTWNFSSYTVLKEIIQSKIMNDRYKLFIGYPENYNPNRIKPYPVLYLPDGNWIEDFSSVGTHGILGMIYKWIKSGNIPDLIFVAIGYPNNQEPATQRQRDFLFDKKADKYFSFMKNELTPYLEGLYNIDPNDRTLLGYSYGGVFSFYTAMQYYADTNRLFKNIMAGDPSLWYPGTTSTCFDLEQAYSAKTDSMPVNYFMATGDTASTNAVFVKLMNSVLVSKKYKGLNNKLEIFPYADHLKCNFPAYEEALYWFFNKGKTDVIFPTYPRDSIYLATPAFNLKNLTEPKGGSFTGDVVNDSVFDPRKAGLGDHLVSYHYIDSNSIEVIRNYIFKVNPYIISLSSDYIYKTDSINSLIAKITLPDAPDTLKATYSLLRAENQYSDFNAYFKISGGNLYTTQALPAKLPLSICIGVQAKTNFKDTFVLPITINIKRITINLTDNHSLTRYTKPGEYLGKITIVSERTGFALSLPDTTLKTYDNQYFGDNQYFEIKNDSLFLKQSISQLSKSGVIVNIQAIQKNGCPAYQKITLSLASDLSPEEYSEFDIFPNPAHNFVQINCSDNNSAVKHVKIIDLYGRVLNAYEFSGSSFAIDISEIKEGIYFIDLESSGHRSIKKIIIEK
jgi:uncharacterized protein